MQQLNVSTTRQRFIYVQSNLLLLLHTLKEQNYFVETTTHTLLHVYIVYVYIL